MTLYILLIWVGLGSEPVERVADAFVYDTLEQCEADRTEFEARAKDLFPNDTVEMKCKAAEFKDLEDE